MRRCPSRPSPPVVGGEAAADRELGQDGDEVVFIPILDGVAEDEIERALKRRDELVGVGQAGIDEGVEPGLAEVGHGFPMTVFVDIDGDELSAGLAQGPRDPDAGVAGRGPDLEGAGVWRAWLSRKAWTFRSSSGPP